MTRLAPVLMLALALAIGAFWWSGSPSALSPKPRAPLFSAGLSPITTGWETTPEKLRAAHCQSCHEGAHDQWASGMHAAAWRDPMFRIAFEHEPQRWCVHCHAPLETQVALQQGGGEDPYGLVDEGVNCAACHVRQGQILGPRARPNDAHVVVETPEMTEARFCAGCHQFNFPLIEGDVIRDSGQPMQDTHSEWVAADPGADCQGCHYEGHRLRGPHDKEWLRARFQRFTHSVADGLLHVRFEVGPRGHRVPSGDLFHALAFEVAADPAFTQLQYQKRWARFYGIGPHGDATLWNRRLIKNSALRPEERVVNLTLDAPGTGPLFGRLVYRYHDVGLGGSHPLPVAQRELLIWSSQLR